MLLEEFLEITSIRTLNQILHCRIHRHPLMLMARLIEKGANIVGIKPPVTRETVDKYI